jgi:excisionase family DNA binding protein
MENIYRLEEVRAIIKVSDSTIRRYIRGGKLKYQRLGREYRITETALREFLEKENTNKKNTTQED